MWMVMGKTSERVYEACPYLLDYERADKLAYLSNMAYRKNRVAVEFYITQVLDV